MTDLRVHPDKEWYESKSQELGLAHKRCPFTAFGKCPLYFMSQSVLDIVFIPADEHKKYQRMWQDTHLWHHVLNYYPKRNLQHTGYGYYFRSICPEVLFHEYGLFAFDLDEWPKYIKKTPSSYNPGEYFNDLVNDVSPEREIMLTDCPPPEGHWLYDYEHVTPLHYSECPLYEYVKEYWANHTDEALSTIIPQTSPLIDPTMRSIWLDKLKAGEIKVPFTTEAIINPFTRGLLINQIRNGDFTAVEAGSQVQEHLPSSVVDNSVESNSNVFRKDGEHWFIVYEGIELPMLDHLDGLFYIQYLLQRSQESILALEIYRSLKPANPDSCKCFASNDEEAGLTICAGDEKMPGIDVDARMQYLKEIKDLSADRQEAKQYNDQATIDRIDREIEFYERELSDSKWHEKSGNSAEEKARKNVTRRIDTAIKHIEQYNSDLSTYLRQTIKKGTRCSYLPDPQTTINWTF